MNEAAEFQKMIGWAAAWIANIKANQERKVAAAKVIRNSPTWKNSDDDTIWVTLHDYLSKRLNESTSGSSDLKIEFRDTLEGLETHEEFRSNGEFHPDRSNCGGSVYLEKKLWSEGEEEFNKKVILHELAHWYDWVIGCFGRSGGYDTTTYSSYTPEQGNILAQLYSDQTIEKKLWSSGIRVKKEDLGELRKLYDPTKLDEVEGGFWYAFNCKGVGGDVSHGRNPAERRAYIEEWLGGRVFTQAMWNDLRMAKRQLSSFDWIKAKSCKHALRLRNRVDALSGRSTGVPFRMEGLVFLNPENENFPALMSGLAASGQNQAEQQDAGGDDWTRPDDQGVSHASMTEKLVKLSTTLDSYDLYKEADRIDNLIVKLSKRIRKL